MAVKSRSTPAKPLTGKGRTYADQLRAFIAKKRIVTKHDILEALGDAGLRSATSLTQKGEFNSPASGIFTLTTVLHDDPRVLDIMRQTGAKPTSRQTLEARARRNEDRDAKELAAESRQASLVRRVREYFQSIDIALLSTLRAHFGPGASAAAETLIKDGIIRRIEDGLYAKPHIDPLGPEMRAHVAAHSIEMAGIKREIETAQALIPNTPIEHDRIHYNLFPPPGAPRAGNRPMRTRLYVNIPNYPSIYAQTGRGGAPSWFGGKGTNLSPKAAESIARMVFDPIPDQFRDLIQLCLGDDAPRKTRLRHGVHDANDSWRVKSGAGNQVNRFQQVPEHSGSPDNHEASFYNPLAAEAQAPTARQTYAYTSNDTLRLHPARLTNPLAEPVILEVDNREPDWILTRLTDVPNLHIVRKTLDIGDYRARFADRELIFERKTTKDLVSSLSDTRLTDQVRRLSEHGSPCCFIIEGGMFNQRELPIARCAAIQTRLIFGMQMPIIETIDRAHTAYAMVTAIREHFFGTADKFNLAPRKVPKAGPVEVAKIMLQSVPGISATKAAALLNRFGTLVAIGSADVTQIAAISGIGLKTAQKISDILNAGNSVPTPFSSMVSQP